MGVPSPSIWAPHAGNGEQGLPASPEQVISPTVPFDAAGGLLAWGNFGPGGQEISVRLTLVEGDRIQDALNQMPGDLVSGPSASRRAPVPRRAQFKTLGEPFSAGPQSIAAGPSRALPTRPGPMLWLFLLLFAVVAAGLARNAVLQVAPWPWVTLVFPPEDATDHLQLAQATLTFLEYRHSHLPWSACGSTEQVP